MSTFLVSFGVVAAAIAAVVYVVLNGPDQPPTIRRQPSRAKDRREGRTEAEVAVTTSGAPRPPVGNSTTPALTLPDSDVMHLRVLPGRRTTLGVRIRSSVVLVLLVAILGALLALTLGSLALGLTLLVRSATG